MKEEMQALIEKETFFLSPCSKSKRPLPCKWIYKLKLDKNGLPERYKARLVVKGYFQKKGVDFHETFAPVLKYQSLRLVLSLAAIFNYEIQQFDVNNAFLNANLEEDLIMEQPLGFIEKGKESFVLKLNKSLYGLKQAPNEWYKEINGTLLEIGFKRSNNDPCIYYMKTFSNHLIIIGLFVDDAVIIYDKKDCDLWLQLKEKIKSKYKIKDIGEATFILGIRIERDRPNRKIYLDQVSYVEKILKRYNFEECNTMSIPGTDPQLLKFDPQKPVLDEAGINLFQQMTGSLLYCAISTRPDISHSVSFVSRYNSKPQAAHLQAVKKIFRYLCGSKNRKLILNGKLKTESLPNSQELKSSDSPLLIAYCDSDHAGDLEDRKSTSGCIIKINDCPIYWSSKKQKCVARSSCEAEVISCGVAVTELAWFRNFLIELKILNNLENSSLIYCDNKSATIIGNEDLANTKTKHIAINYYFIKEAVEKKEIKLSWISSKYQQADIFTKVLGRIAFNKISCMLMGEC